MASKRVGQIEIVVLFTAFIAATYGFGIYLFPAIVEAIRHDLDFSYGTLGVVSGSVQAGFLVSSLLAGFLTLRFGAVNLILLSIVVCALSLAGLVAASSVAVLAAMLVVLGCCASMIWVPMVEVSRKLVSSRNRGKALGLMSSGTSYGVFVNSMLLAIVLPAYGWRALWAIAFAIVASLAAYSVFRLWRLRNGHRNTNSPRPETGTGGWARVVSLPRPLVGGILAMMFLNGFSCMPFQTYLSAYLIGEVGFGDDAAATAWGLIGLVGMASGFLMGALADRISIRRGMIVAYLVLSAAVLSLIFVTSGHAAATLAYAASAAFGLSFYAIFGLVPAYISHLFGDGNAALVFAFGNVALGLGGIAGNLTGGFTKELLGSFSALYLLILAAALASVAIAVILPSEAGHGTE